MLRVVLADDEKKIISLMQKLVDWENLGYQVVGTANDGVRALELVQQKQPHLLITDIRMPGCSGIELIRRAKQLQPGLHFIVISGYRQFEYAQAVLKYGVEDYLLKPLKQDELSDILLRLKDKLGEETALEYHLQKSGERRQDLLIAALKTAAERQQPFLTIQQAEEEYGLHFGKGYYLAALIKPDIRYADQSLDGYRIMMQHTLEIVRRAVQPLADECAAAVLWEGVAVLLYLRDYRAVDVKQCFTKIRKEVEKQRDLFWGIRCTVCLGSRQTSPEQLGVSMQEAFWLCRDRLCHEQPWRDAGNEKLPLNERYQMDAAQRKRFQVAAEYLDETLFTQELEDSYRLILPRKPLNGQMLADWFTQVLEASLYGMRQSAKTEPQFMETMQENFWRCASPQDVLHLLREGVCEQLRSLNEEKSLQETRPITEAKRYIQQHYQQALRLEDVSSAVGFNATYFSVLFKKETGQNFMDYLTELRINKSKELLCTDTLSVQDVAEQVGYHDLKYFSRLFKKTTGVSPSDYKKLYK
ncbi:MAG: response regulator [Eubacteriales bacterium]|nr:response regulator [Eubacteriales bacterium]